MSDIKKVVLAYSEGLDTSAIIPWLKGNYDDCYGLPIKVQALVDGNGHE